MLGNVPIKTAARLMQKSEMFVRMGLRSGALPFGVAIHASSISIHAPSRERRP